LFVFAGLAAAEDAKVTPLMTKDLAGIAGKEATMLTVEYAPGASSPSTGTMRNLRLCIGRLDRDAGEGREGSDAPGRVKHSRVAG
jgi:hypothetical protein